jgi:hypothetical protein
MVPDIAAFADESPGYPDRVLGAVKGCSAGGQSIAFVGGTSAAAPLVAGMIALWSQEAHSQGRPKPGFVPPLLYATAKRDPGAYLDITAGTTRCSAAPAARRARASISPAGGDPRWPTGSSPTNERKTMSLGQHSATSPTSTNGADDPVIEHLEHLGAAYGNRFLLEPSPDNQLPKHGMRSVDAMRLIGEELVLDGIPMRNLATFVTTWMEPEAQRVIAENLHRNFIDHAEYPQTAEIEQRCIRMLATCSTRRARRPARAPRARRRRSCSARCR